MNGKLAKALRRAVYGTDKSPRYREYGYKQVGTRTVEVVDLTTGENVPREMKLIMVVNTGAREMYRRAKKEAKHLASQGVHIRKYLRK